MKSEIEVPEGWDVKRLDEITTIIVSNVDKKINENEIPVSLCNYKDVYDNHYINSKLNFMDGAAKKVEIEKFTLLKNDVIITKDSETKFDIANSSVVIEELKNVICGYHLAILRPIPNVLDGVYLMNVLKIKPVNNHFVKYAQGLTRFGLTIDAINRAKIPFPPFEEQQKIADILSKVDGQIQQTEEIIEKTEELKKGLMQKLLTKGIGHTRFKQTEVGEIPEEWEVVNLHEVSKVTDGSHYSPKTVKSNNLIATVKNMLDNTFDYQSCRTISDEEFEILKHQGNSPKIGDVLFSKDGTVGKTFVFNDKKELIVLSSIAIIRPNENLDSHFLSEVFKSHILLKQLDGLKSGTAIRRVVLKSLKKFKLILPKSIHEQKQIASILTGVDNQIQDDKLQLENLKQLKKGLMQDLLTGRVRVTV